MSKERPHAMLSSHLKNVDSEYEVEGYRMLAASVLSSAISDMKRIGKDREATDAREAAIKFLFSNSASNREIRTFWLAWMGLSNDEFHGMIRRNTYQGIESKIRRYLDLEFEVRAAFANALPDHPPPPDTDDLPMRQTIIPFEFSDDIDASSLAGAGLDS